jgi:DNA-binding NtrC family response regulator
MTSDAATPITILVIGSDPALRELCREGLPWAGCATEFAEDLAEAMTSGVVADVIVADLPRGPHTAALLMHLGEFAEAIGSAVIALTDDASLAAAATESASVQVVGGPWHAERLWDALATALLGRYAMRAPNDCRPLQ